MKRRELVIAEQAINDLTEIWLYIGHPSYKHKSSLHSLS